MRSRILLFAALLAACRSSPKPPAVVTPAPAPPITAEDVARWELGRDRRDGLLAEVAATHASPQVRARALLALGRLQDGASVDVLARGLLDPDAAARREAAFAIGLMAQSWTPLPQAKRDALAAAALAREAAETDEAVLEALREALGKLATPAAVDRLLSRAAEHPPLAVFMGVAFKRGAQASDAQLGALAAGLGSDDAAHRWAAAYALMQSKAKAAAPALRRCLSDADAEVRALCVKGLAEVGSQDDAARVSKLLVGPAAPASEAARALARWAGACGEKGPCPALDALAPLERQLRAPTADAFAAVLALTQAGLPARAVGKLKAMRRAIAGYPREQRQAAASVDCRLAAAMDRAEGRFVEVHTCGFGVIGEPQRWRLGLVELAAAAPAPGHGHGPAKVAVSALERPEPTIQAAALGLGVEAKAPVTVAALTPFLESADLVVAASAALAAAKLDPANALEPVLKVAARSRAVPDVAPSVGEALGVLAGAGAQVRPELERWLASPHPAVRDAAAAALSVDAAFIDGEAPRPVAPAPAGARIVFVTERGEVEVALDTVRAPYTSAHFFALAKAGLYRGVPFHRVVPHFVAQGGDPRGDGEGGPGFTIPCEVNDRRYERGTVGVALSGKDTGGSQFFVALSRQPHLDGRYTAFGEVVRGMEVVDALLEGDLVQHVRVSP